MVDLFLILIGFLAIFLAMLITWPFVLIVCGVVIAVEIIKKTNENFFPQLILTWINEKDGEFPPLFFASLFILSGIFGLTLLRESHYAWYFCVTIVIYITMVFPLEKMIIFSRRINNAARRASKKTFHLLHLFCQKVAEGDGIWWILGLVLYPIKIWYRISRDWNPFLKGFNLIIIFWAFFYFFWRGYLVGHMTDKILYIVFMVLTGAVDIFFD